MANRYWVGGTGNWKDDGNHWATSSGGTPAKGNLPTSLDDVFIDSNSGFGSGGTITVSSNSNCKNFDSSSGHTYTIDVTGYVEIRLFGDLTLESGLTITTIQSSFTPRIETGTMNLTSNGCILPRFDVFQDGGDPVLNIIDNSSFNGNFSICGGSVVLHGNLTATGEFYQENGTFDANDYNVTANDFYFYAYDGYTPTVYMGSGTWEATNNGSDWDSSWYIDEYDGEIVTIYAETSTIKLSGGGSDPKVFHHYDDEGEDSGKIYNDIWITGEGSGSFTIQGSNTFNDFKVNTPPHTVWFDETSTTTVDTFTVSGTVGNLITIGSYQLVPRGSILTGSIANGGSGYSVNDLLTVSIDGFTPDAVLKVESVNGGVVTGVSINDAGTVYIVGTGYPSTGGGGTGFEYNVNSITPLPAQHTLSCSSGTVECDYLNLSNSNATGGATWYAGSHSVDTANNDGWLFEDNNSSDSSERTLYLRGQDTANSERGLYSNGFLRSSSERGLYTIGKSVSSSERGVYGSGGEVGSSERSLYILNISTDNSERGLYTQGGSSDNSERTIYSIGGIPEDSERNLYIRGTWKPWVDKSVEYGTIYTDEEVVVGGNFIDLTMSGGDTFVNDTATTGTWVDVKALAADNFIRKV